MLFFFVTRYLTVVYYMENFVETNNNIAFFCPRRTKRKISVNNMLALRKL